MHELVLSLSLSLSLTHTHTHTHTLPTPYWMHPISGCGFLTPFIQHTTIHIIITVSPILLMEIWVEVCDLLGRLTGLSGHSCDVL
jgi:hypothetical protein